MLSNYILGRLVLAMVVLLFVSLAAGIRMIPSAGKTACEETVSSSVSFAM